MLQRGSTGTAVKDLQRKLGLKTDGVYGPQTEAAVKAFQKTNCLSETGVVDAQTSALLFPPVVLLGPQSRLTRILSVVGKPCTYDLGAGGYDPKAAHPGKACDCSGFASWGLGISRDPKRNKTGFEFWISTDSIYDDAKGGQVLFRQVSTPVVGCLVVYPDKYRDGKKESEGHVAFVTKFDGKTLVGIDCAGSTSRRTAKNLDGVARAINEHDISYFLKQNCVFAVPRSDP